MPPSRLLLRRDSRRQSLPSAAARPRRVAGIPPKRLQSSEFPGVASPCSPRLSRADGADGRWLGKPREASETSEAADLPPPPSSSFGSTSKTPPVEPLACGRGGFGVQEPIRLNRCICVAAAISGICLTHAVSSDVAPHQSRSGRALHARVRPRRLGATGRGCPSVARRRRLLPAFMHVEGGLQPGCQGLRAERWRSGARTRGSGRLAPSCPGSSRYALCFGR